MQSAITVTSSFTVLHACGNGAGSGNVAAPLTPPPSGSGLDDPALPWDQVLAPDSAGLLDLPNSLSYRVVAERGTMMADGLMTPPRPDGMGAFDISDNEVALVCNHEIGGEYSSGGRDEAINPETAYNLASDGSALSGGTTTIILDAESLDTKRVHRSLAGTVRNCAGGETPWGTWISCEETEIDEHGYAFEVDPRETTLAGYKRLTAMGRFEREAVAVDPTTGICFQTEDDPSGLFYRFIPDQINQLDGPGRLEALMIRAFSGSTESFLSEGGILGETYAAAWVPIADPQAAEEKTRDQGAQLGAHAFNGGEGGIVDDENRFVYFVNKRGGQSNSGQIWRYHLETDAIELFYDSPDPSAYWAGDNIYIAPWGDLLVCEDHDQQPCRVIGFRADASSYVLASCPIIGDELAGLCFSNATQTMFINVQGSGKTLAISGDWTAIEAFAQA